MSGRNTLLAVGAVLAGLLLPTQAMAQFEAVTDANLNLRVGPGTNYGVIDVIPYGDVVDVYGCLEDVAWCDVEWWGLRGWVSARYLVQPGTSVYLPQVYARIGVPIISFSFSTYHDRYYRDRPWYRERSGRWRGRDWRRGDRPRRERSEERRDRRDAERPREQQREVEPSRQQRQIERAKRERLQQLQEAEQPRQQREVEPSRQQRQIERAKQKRQQQLQEAEQPRQGERTKRPRQAQEAEQPRQRKRPPEGRSDSDGPPEELLYERGQ
jgi:uncharacterized protein YraI